MHRVLFYLSRAPKLYGSSAPQAHDTQTTHLPSYHLAVNELLECSRMNVALVV